MEHILHRVLLEERDPLGVVFVGIWQKLGDVQKLTHKNNA